jgi:hypothetical protein
MESGVQTQTHMETETQTERGCTAYVAEWRALRAERADLEKRIRQIDRTIKSCVRWCTHEWERKREECQYGETYHQCRNCGELD